MYMSKVKDRTDVSAIFHGSFFFYYSYIIEMSISSKSDLLIQQLAVEQWRNPYVKYHVGIFFRKAFCNLSKLTSLNI